MKFNIKDLFVKPTIEDKSCFYSFQRIFELAPRHYVIRGCTKGFISLMKRSNIPCELLGNGNNLEIMSTGGYFEIEYSNEEFTSILAELMKRRQ